MKRGEGDGGEGVGASEYYPHPIMISIITLTTLMDIKIVCDMVIRAYVCGWLGL